MASRSGVDGVEESEVLLLLKEYCSKRSQQRSNWREFRPGSTYPIYSQGLGLNDESEELTFRSSLPSFQGGASVPKDDSSATTRTAVTGRLVQIAESAPIPEVDEEDQDEIIQKLIKLMKTSGDDINKKIKQNKILQQQLKTLSYDMFERLTSSVQSLVGPEGKAAAPASDKRIQKQRIAWAFEVTSRLSAVDIIPKRRVLNFADRYIQQHHNAWLQQHGGWEGVFDGESVD